MQRFFLIISGPTGVGKTAFVMRMADMLAIPVVIINGDMGQMYTPLTIGTAKPSKSEQEKFEHCGFDILNEPGDFTVTQYRAVIISLLEKCWAENKFPIIVGGSGFYLKSILFAQAEKDHEARLILRQAQDERDGESCYSIADKRRGNQDLDHDEPTQLSPWEYLQYIDPVRAREIHPHDTYRIHRALELWKKTGILPSEQKPLFRPPGEFYFLFLTRDRQDLYARINKRTEHMIQHGWLDEVKNVSPAWREFLIKKKIIGYPEIIAFCEKESKMHIAQLISDIQAKTRAYAKKQCTFWRSLKAQIVQADTEKKNTIDELNLTLSSSELYLNQLVNNLKKKYYEPT